MRYVNRFVSPSGEVFLYLRKKGLPKIRLRSPDGSPELAREVEALVKGLEPPKAVAGTLALAARHYELESADFRSLAASTKYEYRLAMYEIVEDYGQLAVQSFTAAMLVRMRDTWAKRGHRAANVRLQVLKNILRPALIANGIETDPFSFVSDVRRPRDLAEPHLIWPASVFATVIEAAIAQRRFGLARAIAIARFAGARRGDLVRIPRSARAGGRFQFRSGKRNVAVDVPEDPMLTHWLDETPQAQPLSPWQAAQDRRDGVTRIPPATLVYNRSSLAYTEDGIGQELRKVVDQLQRADKLLDGRFDFHGLRHTRGVEIALAGCSDAQGAAMLGHASPASFAAYRRQADKIAMGDQGQARIAALREQRVSAEVTNDCQKSDKS
jgi:integrase